MARKLRTPQRHSPQDNRKYTGIESAVFGIKPIQSLTEPRDRNTFFAIESSRQAPDSFLRKLCCWHLKVGIRDKEIFCWLVREKVYSVKNQVSA